MSGLKTALASLWSPVRSLAEAADARRFMWPLILATLVGIGFNAAAVTRLDFASPAADALEMQPDFAKLTPHERVEKIEQAVKIGVVGSLAKGALGPASSALAAAFLLWLGFKVAGGKPAFGATFAVVAHAWLPDAVRQLVTLPALLTQSSVAVMDFAGMLPSSLAALAPDGTSMPKLALLSAVDLFTVWSVGMVAAGMAHAGKVSALRSTVVVTLLWASYVLVFNFAIPTLSMAPKVIPMVHLLLAALLAAAPAPPAAEAPNAPSAALGAGPLTLDAALALAARQNPDLQLVRLQGEGAGVEAYASYAYVLPRLDLGIGFGYSYSGPRKETIAIPTATFDPATNELHFGTWDQQVTEVSGIGVANYSLGIQLQQPLFDGLRGPRQIQRARLGVAAAARQVDESALALSFEVTRRFYEVVKADRNVQVLQETVTRSEEFAQRSEALFVAGRVPKSDTIAARVNLGNDRINLETQRARALQTRADLAQALALTPKEIGEVAASADVDSDAVALREPPPADQLTQKARQARPAFARAEALLEQARLDKKIATADYWPMVNGTLGYNRAGPSFAGSEGVWGNPARQYVASASVGIQWNLFNGRQTAAAQQRADIAERTAQAQALQLALQVEADLARARASVLALGQAVQLAGENLKAAEEGVRLAQQRLEAGAATQLEVRDAALKLTQAKLTLVNARIDALVARAELNRAAGGAL